LVYTSQAGAADQSMGWLGRGSVKTISGLQGSVVKNDLDALELDTDFHHVTQHCLRLIVSLLRA